MIKARHKAFWVHFFNTYTRLMLKKHFADVEINGYIDDYGKAVLLIGNHVSWWDGFWSLYVNNKRWKKRFHIMMLEEELTQRMFLNKAGAYSIKKGTRDVLESLHYTTMLLNNPENIVVMFPQGQIRSMHEYPVMFEKGVWHVIKKLNQEIKVVFQISLTDYFSSVKPYLRVYLKEVPQEDIGSRGELEQVFNAFLRKAIACQTPDSFN